MAAHIARAFAESAFFGGTLVYLWHDFFVSNPEPTHANAVKFAVAVTIQFSGFFLPIAVEFVKWYETLPYYTAYAYKKFHGNKIVHVYLVRGFNKPTGDLLEEPFETKPISSTYYKFAAVACIVFVFFETFLTGFIQVNRTLWLLLSCVFIPLFGLVIFLFFASSTNYEDEARRLVCEHEAKRRVEEEVRALLGEKV